MHRFVMVALVLLCLPAPAQAARPSSCMQAGRLGTPASQDMMSQTKYCGCVMGRVRESAELSEMSKRVMFASYNENPYIVIGVDPEAVRSGKVQLTDQQEADVIALEDIWDICSAQAE